MACFLQIETSTKACSLAISVCGNVVFGRENFFGISHASDLGVYALEAVEYVKKNRLKIDALAVSAGPGSYTGLRIGVSLAKGLCYGLELPLIAIPSLRIILQPVFESRKDIADSLYFCPMIDARRMEVYAAVYDKNGTLVRDVNADIVNENTYEEFLSQGKVLFFGDGSGKCKTIIQSPNAVFIDEIYPMARNMTSLTEEAFAKRDFVDLAYFEPFYLKEFQATVARNKVIPPL